MIRQRVSRLAIALAATLAATGLGGCSDDDGKVSDSTVYTEVLRHLANRSTSDPDPLDVFVAAYTDSEPLSLDTEIGVIGASKDFATVTFVDDDDEAFDDPERAAEIVGDGIIVVLGPVVRRGSDFAVEVGDVAVSGEVTFRSATLSRSASGAWTVTGLG